MDAFVEHLNAVLPDSYRVEEQVGAGGMATVYRALDVRHDRHVAVKVLRPELAAVVGADRFLTEIRVTAGLQHPHILPLHDSGEADGLLYYVMPFVPGESLRDRLERETQLPVEEALRITREVADGLGHAHELGVIHRDVKPENILLTGEHALVADFGIARAVSEAGGSRITETGITLGTPPYMSPEQATAEANVDARSDQYSLACVLYEMLVGEPPFTGPTARAVMAKVLTQRPPPVREARELVDAGVDATIQKALAKLPADRFPTVRDFAESLRDPPALRATHGISRPGDGGRRSRSPSEIVAWTLVAILAVAVTALLLRATRPGESEGVTRMVLDPRPADAVAVGAHLVPTELGAEVDVLAISADGRRIAFVGRGADGETRIYLRELGAYEARALPQTESSTSPFFSPDGDWVGFYSWPDRRLKRLPVSGGTPQVICQCEPILSADWGPDGTVVMDSWGVEGLRVVPASGGVPEGVGPQETMEADEYALSHPDFLPDGRHVLVTAWGGGGSNRRIAAVAVDEGGRTTLLEEGWTPQFALDGHLVYQRANQL
ncbi:MAG: protein kinase, partial [Gemmatimonadota bacterium]